MKMYTNGAIRSTDSLPTTVYMHSDHPSQAVKDPDISQTFPRLIAALICFIIHVMHILLPMLSVHHKCHHIFYRHIHDDSVSTKNDIQTQGP